MTNTHIHDADCDEPIKLATQEKEDPMTLALVALGQGSEYVAGISPEGLAGAADDERPLPRLYVKMLLDGVKPHLLLTDPPYCSGGFQEAGKSAGSIGTQGRKNESEEGPKKIKASLWSRLDESAG